MKFLYIAGTVFFTAYGQLIVKWRIGCYGPLPDNFQKKFIFLLRLFTDYYIVSGFIAAFVASLFWMAVMSKTDISFAYPITTAGLILLTTLIATTILGETLSFPKAFGVILIISGIAIMQC